MKNDRPHAGEKRLNKLFIMTHNMAGGGCERVIAQLANRFAAMGVDCTVLTEYRHESFYPLDPRVRLLPLSERTDCRSKDIPRTYLRLRKLAKSERPDLVLAMPEKVNAWTVLFLLGSGVPVVPAERNDPRRHPESRIKRLLRDLLYPFAAGYVFQTEQQRDCFPARIRARGAVLDNPLDLSRIPAPLTGVRQRTVVTAARLSEQKNLPLLIEAFAKFLPGHPDWRLRIYGEGPEAEALKERLSALPEGSGTLMGVSRDLPNAILDAGMFVLSSDYEGMPNALIEAMAAGLPCISTDCPAGGPASLIRDGENGLLVPTGDADALSVAMARIADAPAFSETLAHNALMIRDRLDAGVVAEKWRRYLERCCQ